METAEIKRRWLAFFGERGHTVVPERLAAARRPQPAVRQRRHGAVQALLPRPGDAAVPPRHQRAEVRAHPRHRGGRQDHPARHVLPDERQLLLRRLLQGRRHRARLGARHPAAGRRRLRLRRGGAVRHRLRTTTTRPSRCGRRSPACPTTASCGCGNKDNYWRMGVPGPGGPCSEILIDRGPEFGADGGPGRRATATWSSGTSSSCSTSCRRSAARRTSTSPATLPKKNIDTGMGLERVAYLLQGVDNLYEIDEVYPVLDRAAELAGKRYGARATTDDVRLRVVADHVRSALMLIGDGVTPGNEAARLRAAPPAAPRGALDAPARRRRAGAARAAADLQGRDGAVLPRAGARLRPHLADRVRRGGDLPAAPSAPGTTILDTAVARDQGGRAAPTLTGERAFQLHDTYGFPIDLTLEMAAEQGLESTRTASAA